MLMAKADPTPESVKVLLVERDSQEAGLIKDSLAGSNLIEFQLTHVPSLQDGLQTLVREKYDIVLLSLDLPDSAKSETFEGFYLQNPLMPIVVLTELADEPLGLKAVRHGAQDYVIKESLDKRRLPRMIRYTVERKQLEDELRQAQKMDAIGRLAGGVAHDFNNLLTVISGYTDLRLQLLAKDDPIRSDFEEIQKAARHATAITGQLLGFSGKQIIRPQVMAINDLIVDLTQRLSPLIGEDIELVTLLGENAGAVRVDPVQFEQVLLNLVLNAKGAIGQHGKVSIETENVSCTSLGHQFPWGFDEGRYVRVNFKDNGCGMSEEVRQHVFEPFFTTKEKAKGAGFGLATAYGIVTQLGGHIYIKSEINKGTTITIYLPQVDAAVAVEEAVKESPRSSTKGSETILVAEDETLVRGLVVRVLRAQGYTVLEAANGIDAIRILQEKALRHLDLLLTDVVMPQMGGKELADKMCAFHPNVKILFMSGYAEDAIVEDGVLNPDVNFLHKPFLPMKLATMVRDVLDS